MFAKYFYINGNEINGVGYLDFFSCQYMYMYIFLYKFVCEFSEQGH